MTYSLILASVLALGRSNRQFTRFNQVTFDDNVIKSNWTDHWVVLFCVDWYGPCEELSQPYRALGKSHEEKLNNGLFSNTVRFAEVDCATDKVLCNEQIVDDYPTIVHYNKGERVARWQTTQGTAQKMTPKLVSWLETELLASGGPRKGRSQARQEASDEIFREIISQILPFAVATVAMTVMVLGFGADVCSAAQAALHPQAAPPLKVSLSKNIEREQNRVPRMLPAEWARDRGSLEL